LAVQHVKMKILEVQYAGIALFYLLHIFVCHLSSIFTPWTFL